QRVNALNHLSSLQKIDFLKSSNEPNKFIYLIRDPMNKSNSSILIANGITDQMERIVYQVVKESENLAI
ncbi:unnamed protein product, partial [Rotaria sp. Silwood2]